MRNDGNGRALSLVLLVCIGLGCPAAIEAQQAATSTEYSISDRGAFSTATSGTPATVSSGYARIQPGSGNTAPAGVAVFALRQNNVTVSEAGVPASPLITSGRVYAEVNGSVSTGVAIANPGAQAANIDFYFTDQTGGNFGSSTTTVPAGAQIAAFLNQAPFNGGASINGTFTFISSAPIAVIALRGLTNERSEFLMTTLPVSPLTAVTGGTAYFPQFADGGGWRTQAVLVNTTDDTMTGSVQFFGQGSFSETARQATVTIDGRPGGAFSYTIPPRSSRTLQTDGSAGAVTSGSIRVLPAGNSKMPAGVAIFSFRNAGVTVSEAGVAASQPGSSFRLYAEAATTPSVRTGIAIANGVGAAATVNFELTTLDGSRLGLAGSASVPGNGQVALFLDQIRGFQYLAQPFHGQLRLTTTAPAGISIVGLRGRSNERGDFLITTTPAVAETSSTTSEPLYFPHIADGGGYTTQFIMFNGSPNPGTSGIVQFFTQAGQGLNATLVTERYPIFTLAPPAGGNCIAAALGQSAWDRMRRDGTASQQESEIARACGLRDPKGSFVRKAFGPVPPVTLPSLTIQGDFPCGADNARAEFGRFYPSLVFFMGEPFTMVRDGLTWWWDTTSGMPGHGFDAATNVIRFPPGEAQEQGLTGDARCQQIYASFIRETAHLFWDVGPTNISFGPQWMRQAQVGAAVVAAGSESPFADDYDLRVNAGFEKVNGVASNGLKYGDSIGSNGRATVDGSAAEAMLLLADLLTYDSGQDLLKRVNERILGRFNASHESNFAPAVYAPILTEVSGGRTVDGMAPGDWLLAQPVSNSVGMTGLFLVVTPSGGPRAPLVAAFERRAAADGSRQEVPVGNLDVNLTFIDSAGAVKARKTVKTRAGGDVNVETQDVDLGLGAVLLSAEATVQGQPLSAANLVLSGQAPNDDEMIIVPLNADGSALRPETVAQFVVTGADSVNTSRAGMLVVKAKPETAIDLRLGTFHKVLSKPLRSRIVPLRIP